jgi:O-antigen/teichoic acid export membrane protein
LETFEINKYLKKSIISGISKSILVNIITISFIPLIIQRIGIEYFGILMLTLSFSSLSAIIDLGISKSVTLLLGQENETTEKNKIVSGAILINLVLAIVISLIVCLLVYMDIPVFGSNFDNREYTILILWLSLIVLIFSLFTNLATSILEAYLLMHYVNFVFAFSSVLLYSTLFFISFITLDLKILLILSICPSILSFLIYLIIVIRKTGINFVIVDKTVLKKLTKTSFRFLNIGIVNSLIFPANKYLLVLLTGSSALTGVFDVCIKISLSANSYLNSISAPLFGIFSNMKVKEKIYKIVKKATIILFINFLLGVTIYYILNHFIALIVDKDNSDLIAETSMLLLIGVTSTGVAEPAYRALLSSSRLKEAFYLKLVIPLSNIIFYVILLLSDISDILRINLSISVAMFLGSLVTIIYYFKSNKE